MTISINLRQMSQPVLNGISLTSCVTDAQGIDPAVFVYTVSTNKFSTYATLSEMLLYPADRTSAQTAGLPYYRSTSYTRVLDTLETLKKATFETASRVQQLVNDWTASGGTLCSDVTTTIVPST